MHCAATRSHGIRPILRPVGTARQPVADPEPIIGDRTWLGQNGIFNFEGCYASHSPAQANRNLECPGSWQHLETRQTGTG